MPDLNRPSHIELHFTENGADFSLCYAMDERAPQEAEDWSAGRVRTEESARRLRDWFNAHGGKLDRADGPACVEIHANGTRIEQWYRDGKLHRANGPAHIAIHADGTYSEAWYRDAKLYRVDGPAWVERGADGSRAERWYRDDIPDRADGPACITVHADGTWVEEWWVGGHQIKERCHVVVSPVAGRR
jgi:hypothetical protein